MSRGPFIERIIERMRKQREEFLESLVRNLVLGKWLTKKVPLPEETSPQQAIQIRRLESLAWGFVKHAALSRSALHRLPEPG